MKASGTDRATQALGAALTMAVAVALFAYGGVWLDRKVGSSPAFLIVGVLIGAAGGFLHIVLKLSPELLPFRKRTDDASSAPADSEPDPPS